MADQLQKLRPDRDLQCYFFEPSAIAALSNTSATGFTVSGTWRQQFDWAVVEWNRDNVFEHPLFRNLPDGDLSGVVLTYDESRVNCIALDSDLYATVDWPYLRLWVGDPGGAEHIHWVPLKSYATPLQGAVVPASISLTLQGSPSAGDYVGFSFLDEHYTYQLLSADTLPKAMGALSDAVNAFSKTMRAELTADTTIALSYVGMSGKAGANGNRVGVYTYVSGAGTESWDKTSDLLQGGTSPSVWQIRLDFSNLRDRDGIVVPTTSVRKVRWTWAADLQPSAFVRSEFSVAVSNWSVAGTNLWYRVNGPGGFRIEDTDPRANFTGSWSVAKGNYSGGTIRHSQTAGSTVSCRYTSASEHSLFLGSRLCYNGGAASIIIDNGPAVAIPLLLPGEDTLARIHLADLPVGAHNVNLQVTSDTGYVYFDFFDVVVAQTCLPTVPTEQVLALATDWDTEHCLALAPERTAWMIHSLGLYGRVNHYAGALWFFELHNPGSVYASGTLSFLGTPQPNAIVTISIGRTGEPATTLSHLNLIGDTGVTIAKALELIVNQGSTAVWASASGGCLTLQSRSMGSDGNAITISGSSDSSLQIATSGDALSGGTDADWLTDLNAMPRLNRAARDWSQGFFEAIHAYGLDCVAAFSTELQFGDPSIAAGIAQRYPSGNAVVVNTPALQTNFSPTSLAFWRQVYADMAGLQANAGLIPYLQCGEVQWWYFPDDSSGLPFYDAYTTSTFRQQYGRDLAVITERNADPQSLPQETSFLRGLIAQHTSAIIQFVRSTHPSTRFEVLYPTDANDTALMQSVNYASDFWTPENLTCLKTESFTYTYARNLDLCRSSMQVGEQYGFKPSHRSHLIGVGDSSTAWDKEARLAQGMGFESVVLFALDQMCLLGNRLPVSQGLRRSFQAK